jgi:hypothetical protein
LPSKHHVLKQLITENCFLSAIILHDATLCMLSGRGLESSDVSSVGVPYNVALGKGPAAIDEYFRTAQAAVKSMREPLSAGAGPLLSPIDQLRLELDELWPDGACVTKDKQGRLFLPGLARIMKGPTRHTAGFVHVDDMVSHHLVLQTHCSKCCAVIPQHY